MRSMGAALGEYRVSLQGWQAAAVGGLIAIVVIFHVTSRFQRVDDHQGDAVRQWLLLEYQGHGVASLMRQALDHRTIQPLAASPGSQPMKIDVTVLSAHGTGLAVVVEARIAVNDGAPPDGRSIRYFNVDRNAGGNWFVFSDANSLAYYTALLH
jgi:hypothetical protein